MPFGFHVCVFGCFILTLTPQGQKRSNVIASNKTHIHIPIMVSFTAMINWHHFGVYNLGFNLSRSPKVNSAVNMVFKHYMGDRSQN
jgi:hypothetical protein